MASSSTTMLYGQNSFIPAQTNGDSPSTVASSVGHAQQLFGAISSGSSCGHCKTISSQLLLCSRCKNVHYCNVQCQRAAWKTHQIICNNHFLIPEDDEIVCKLQDSNGVRDLTQNEFRRRMNLTFVSEPLFSKDALNAIQFSENPEWITLSEKPAIEDSIALHYQGEEMGHGVIALKKIPKGTVICGYGGVAFPDENWSREPHTHRSCLYAASGGNLVFDAAEHASLGAIVNDGFPNCELKSKVGLKIYSGTIRVPLEKVIVAIKDIEEGEALYIDYGSQHMIKKAPYRLEESAFHRMAQKYSQELDISFLNKTGWVFSAVDSSKSDTSDLVTSTEIEYIMTTPSALALLHLRTDLDAAKTLLSLDALSQEIKGRFPLEIEDARTILKGLTKIKRSERIAFSEIVSKISQRSLIGLCNSINESPSQPSMEDCEKFGSALDKLRLMFFGTLSGSYWSFTEKEEFKKLFLSEEHQKRLHDDTDIQTLPEKFKESYRVLRANYMRDATLYLFLNNRRDVL
ncbi:MAG: zinc finger MYND domain-containing protein [Chlamydiales bacterium]